MNKFLFGFLVIVTTALMGSSFAIGKIGLAYSSPLLLVALRFTIAGVIMAIVVKILKKPHPKKLGEWKWLVLIGSLQTAAVMGCIFIALRTITSGETSILTFTNPLLVVVIGTLVLRIRYRLQQWIGVICGLLGVFITMGAHLDLKIGTVLGFISAIAWACSTLIVKVHGYRFDTWVMTAYQMLFGGLILFIASFLLEEPFFEVNALSLGILAWLAIAASIIQFSIWFYLLQTGNPERTSAFLFLAPFFGTLSGWLLLDEKLSYSLIAGGLLISLGIFLVNWRSKRELGRLPA
ncbi:MULTISPECIES: DMT family transporter [Sporosarcina]|uniref:DMT family transporter n=1 Tax=Sporosarcina TaxID=1569 RepID=UPI00129BC50E|nr:MULTISPECIES: DMT family transporter [Sporosarcina]GKV64381.1 EamA family transporter [Sporosarcina sp. NCCP-2331]GLB55126.1 EamA family transporter [Sporosarcina sp. NCCP-2378]